MLAAYQIQEHPTSDCQESDEGTYEGTAAATPAQDNVAERELLAASDCLYSCGIPAALAALLPPPPPPVGPSCSPAAPPPPRHLSAPICHIRFNLTGSGVDGCKQQASTTRQPSHAPATVACCLSHALPLQRPGPPPPPTHTHTCHSRPCPCGPASTQARHSAAHNHLQQPDSTSRTNGRDTQATLN